MGRQSSLSNFVSLQLFRHLPSNPAHLKHEEAEEASNPGTKRARLVRTPSSSSMEDEDDSSSSCIHLSLSSKLMRRHSTGCAPKSVRFGDCKIRSYPQVLGDHPCCSLGCPLELGWDHFREETLKVNDFEEQRDHQRRRSKGELLLSPEERRSILTRSTEDVGAIRKACRRQATRMAQRKIQQEFFAS